LTEKCECYATISERDPRGEIWKYVTGDGRIPLKHPLSSIVKSGPFEGMEVYHGDPSKLTEEQKQRLIKKLSQKFGIPPKEIQKDLAKGLLPIKAENVIVSICSLHFRIMVM